MRNCYRILVEELALSTIQFQIGRAFYEGKPDMGELSVKDWLISASKEECLQNLRESHLEKTVKIKRL
jgi:hypothetical protein